MSLKTLKKNIYFYSCVFFANILSFIGGTAASWASPVIPKLKTDSSYLGYKITQNEASLVGSLGYLGCILSPIIYGFLTEKLTLSRKLIGVLMTLPILLGFCVMTAARIIEVMYFSIFLVGVGAGTMYITNTIYVVEIAKDSNRGRCITSVPCFQVAGILFSNSVGPFVSITVFNLILALIVLLYIITFWFLTPETPYYLVQTNQHDEALESLKYLRRSSIDSLNKELEKIKLVLSLKQTGTYSEIFQYHLRAFVYSTILAISGELAGISVYLTYMQTIFNLSKTSISSKTCTIIVFAVELFVAIISSSVADCFGRKILLFVSAIGAAIAEISLGLYFYIKEQGENVEFLYWLPLSSLTVFIVFFKLGIGTISWPMTSEILPPHIVFKGTLIMLSIFSTVAFLQTFLFSSLSNLISVSSLFWFYGSSCILFALFIVFFLIETKGKSLYEIQMILQK